MPSASPRLAMSRRLRTTPYMPRVEALGVSDYSVVNHTILPKGFGRSVDEDYWHLSQHVQLWDVSCQRQVELRGPHAARLAQMMTPRDLRSAETGQCLYAPLVDERAGMINDPVILKLGADHFWLSISDSDVLLWAKGLALGFGLDVEVDEPDVSPLAVQGPKAEQLMVRVFGEAVRRIRFFRFQRLEFVGRPLVVARSGYGTRGGFEIYLDDGCLGPELWDTIWRAGTDLNLRPGGPNLIDRVEGGLLSYGNEMTRQNNPLECGLGRFCRLDGSIDFIGRDALIRISEAGPGRMIRGIMFGGDRCPPCAAPWPVLVDGKTAGHVTTAIWSPRLDGNIALGMLDRGYWRAGTQVLVAGADGRRDPGVVVDLPFRKPDARVSG